MNLGCMARSQPSIQPCYPDGLRLVPVSPFSLLHTDFMSGISKSSPTQPSEAQRVLAWAQHPAGVIHSADISEPYHISRLT